MSEYQYYEFAALEKPLTRQQMEELRDISSRATITPTAFQNEYNYGDLKAKPIELLEKYFDIHLYVTNWGTRRLMLRLPKNVQLQRALQPYVGHDNVQLTATSQHLILSLTSDTEEPEDEWWEGQIPLPTLTTIWYDLRWGSIRAAYIAWLSTLCAEYDNPAPEAVEPPLPAGLKDEAALVALADFLRVDTDLLAAATAPSAPQAPPSSADWAAWLAELPVSQKDQWLLQAMTQTHLTLGPGLLALFGEQRSNPIPSQQTRRTVEQLWQEAKGMAELRQQQEQRAEAERLAKVKMAREHHLQGLAQDPGGLWEALEGHIEGRRYDQAGQLAVDLEILATRQRQLDDFQQRFAALRKKYSRRRNFFNQREAAWQRAKHLGEL
ncbi:MAG: hypothetical protein ACFCBW_01910 [Candidatus Competibacterales bacterium]